MTKSIDAQGYLLVERTTPSCPDPVPNINDESGSFSGSGFANTGENLVLKDSGGTTIQTLDFSSGWPAGDATTKQTMQWDGSRWVTALATPKAPSQTSGGGDTQPPPEPTPGMAWSAPKILPHIDLTIPKTIYSTVVSEYSQKTFLEYGEAYYGIFLWNMGDGTVYRNNTPSVITHAYKYPGTYTIVYAYYKTPYDIKPVLVESEEHLVISPTISLRTISDKGFEFSNSGDVPVDISGWIISLIDTTVELPPQTIVAPKKTVLMPFSVFGLKTSYEKGILQTPQWVAIADAEAPKEILLSTKRVSTTKTYSSVNSEESSILSASTVDALPEAPKNKATKSQTKLMIFVVALVVVIGLFIVLERFISSRAQE